MESIPETPEQENFRKLYEILIIRLKVENEQKERKAAGSDEHPKLSKVKSEISKELEKRFECSECPSTFRRLHHFKAHVRFHTGEKPYTCPECGRMFGHPAHISRHMRAIHNLPPAPTTVHSEVNSSPDDVEKKFKLQKKHQKTSKDLVKCEYETCNEMFTFRHNMIRHMKLVHSAQRPFQCSECPKSLKTDWSLQRHLRTHGIGIVENMLECEECGDHFPTNWSYNHHKRIVHKVKTPFKCDECVREYITMDELERHQRCHQKPRVTCDICGRNFTEKCNLSRHKRNLHPQETLHEFLDAGMDAEVFFPKQEIE